jgi:hypothetical protein
VQMGSWSNDTSESTASESFKRFCATVPVALGREYLRDPTAEEVVRIEAYAALGFPGASDAWTAQAGSVITVQPHSREPIMGREKGLSAEWRLFVMTTFIYMAPDVWDTGSKNDISIMNASTLLYDIRAGKWPPCRPPIEVAGFPPSWFYYLADGMYPRFQIFVLTWRQPRTLIEKLFAKHREGARKFVERVFRVLSGLEFCSGHPEFCVRRTCGMLFGRAVSCTT